MKIINDEQKGFVFKNGAFKGIVGTGKYAELFGNEIEVVPARGMIQSEKCSADVLLKNSELSKMATILKVEDRHIAIHYINGNYADCIVKSGKYAFWNIYEEHTFKDIDTSEIDVTEDIPPYIIQKISQFRYKKVEISEYEKGRLYYNKKFIRLLEPGTYYFWIADTQVDVEKVDTRLVQMNISGQEMLTLDKVALRINFVCTYRITDCIAIAQIDDYEEQLRIAAQLALREFVGRYKVDEILESKEKMSAYVLDRLKGKEKTFFVEVYDAGVKDIILPGEIRDIMNTVLVAEKRAQANVITRREEVASTRSLLNIAKLMDENKTLYKLKELEYIERICCSIDSLNLGSNGDILSQLMAAVKGGGN